MHNLTKQYGSIETDCRSRPRKSKVSNNLKMYPITRLNMDQDATRNLTSQNRLITSFIFVAIVTFMSIEYLITYSNQDGFVLFANGHIVLTKDDHGSSLVLTGEDGKGGGKGKGKGGGDQLVIAGHNMGGTGQDTNMVMQDASNREGDVVIQGQSMIVPGEEGHIVLADGRSKSGGGHMHRTPLINPMMFWLPYINSRSMYRMMPFYFGHFG